jgi:hypothetical protein
MKARVKATGEIVEVKIIDQLSEEEMYVEKFGEMSGRVFHITELDFDNLDNPDYWTRLEHQYAGVVMQGILGNQTYTKNLLETSTSAKDARDIIVDASCYLAHALVEKMKEER